MSSKNHVQDSSVVERRLRPIYEWLDSGNNKKSLQECEKVLKKTPNLLCAKALKALTLLRIGKENDSVSVLDSLIDEKPTDEATLQAMTLCCRELQQVERICKIYETAVKLEPSNEELHTHLFMSYVRISDFKSQHKAAMALYKFKPKSPYYCWAVMSVVLQATRGEGKHDEMKKQLLLSLAERMMDKLITENKMEAEPQIQLYMLILEQQGKYKEIMEIFDGPLGSKLICTELHQARMPYLIKLNRWNDLNVICKQILVKHVDRWNVWKDYVHSVVNLMSENENNESSLEGHDLDAPDNTPERAHEFICRLVENGVDNGYLLRGPYLARFELCSKLTERHYDCTELLGENVELFVEYFRKFGHKSCCVTDLRAYLKLLDEEKKSDLTARLLKDVGISATNIPKSEQQMQRHICALQLSRLCGSHASLPDPHLKALVTAFSLHYQHGYQSYGTSLLPTDMGPSDPYAILAVHVLYDLAQVQNSSEPIFAALVLLECLLKNSPSNFHAKLLCVRLYHTLGGGIGAQNWYNSLEIKHLQLDSLGYIHCARLPTTGLIGYTTTLLDASLKFFASNYKDSTDHLTSSYKFGSFGKLEEFMDFREKLNNSFHYTSVTIDRIMLTLMCTLNIESLNYVNFSNPNWDEIMFNYDLSVYASWDPERIHGTIEDSEQIRNLNLTNVDFFKLRAQVIQCVITSLDLIKSSDESRRNHAIELEKSLENWKKLEENVRKKHANLAKTNHNRVTLPLPSRLHCALTCPYWNILGGFFEYLVMITRGNFDISSSEILMKIKTELCKLTENVDNLIRDTLDFLQLRSTMEYVVNNIEIVSISCILYNLCNEVATPHKQGKKGKKNNSTFDSSKWKEPMNELKNTLKTTLIKFDTSLHLWSGVSAQTNIAAELETLNLNCENGGNNNYNDVFKNILSSHIQAVNELQSVLNAKLKLIGCS